MRSPSSRAVDVAVTPPSPPAAEQVVEHGVGGAGAQPGVPLDREPRAVGRSKTRSDRRLLVVGADRLGGFERCRVDHDVEVDDRSRPDPAAVEQVGRQPEHLVDADAGHVDLGEAHRG